MHVLAIWVSSLVKYLFRFFSPGCAVCVSFWVVGCSPEDSLQVPAIWASLMTREVAGIFVVSPAALLSVKVECACALSPSSPHMVSSLQDSKAFWGTGRERRQHRLWCHWHLSFYLLRGKWFYMSVSTAALQGYFSHLCHEGYLLRGKTTLNFTEFSERQNQYSCAVFQPRLLIRCKGLFCLGLLTIPSVLNVPNVIKSSLLKWKTQINTKPIMVGDIIPHFL